jgi:hypothetical protein
LPVSGGGPVPLGMCRCEFTAPTPLFDGIFSDLWHFFC